MITNKKIMMTKTIIIIKQERWDISNAWDLGKLEEKKRLGFFVSYNCVCAFYLRFGALKKKIFKCKSK